MEYLEPYVDQTMHEWQMAFDSYLSNKCNCPENPDSCCEVRTLRDFIKYTYQQQE